MKLSITTTLKPFGKFTDWARIYSRPGLRRTDDSTAASLRRTAEESPGTLRRIAETISTALRRH